MDNRRKVRAGGLQVLFPELHSPRVTGPPSHCKQMGQGIPEIEQGMAFLTQEKPFLA